MNVMGNGMNVEKYVPLEGFHFHSHLNVNLSFLPTHNINMDWGACTTITYFIAFFYVVVHDIIMRKKID